MPAFRKHQLSCRPWDRSWTGGDGDESDGDGTGDGGNGGCGAVQVEPKSSRAGGNAFHDAGGEGHEESSREDDDGCRERWRLVIAACSDDGAKEQEKANKGEDFVDHGERRLEGLARNGYEQTRDESGSEEPGNGGELFHGQ